MGITNNRRGKSALVGLDIQANSLAAAEVVHNQPGGVTKAAISELASGLILEGEILDEDGLAAAIKSFMLKHKFDRHVRLGVANQRVVVRTIEVPVMDNPDEQDTVVRFTAGEHLPMPLEEAVIDYRVIKRFNVDNGSPKDQVIVVAAPKEMAERIVAVTDKAGLKLDSIDLSAFALIRALYGADNGSHAVTDQPTETSNGSSSPDSPTDSQDAVGYCHIGAVTNLAVAHGPTCTFARTIPYGVDSMVVELALRKDISSADAKAWLNHVGLEQDLETVDGDSEIAKEARDVLIHCSTTLANELRDSLDFYASQPDSRNIVQTLVTGPGLEIAGLLDAIDEKIPLPLNASEPKLNQSFDIPPSLLTLAYGLALDEVVS